MVLGIVELKFFKVSIIFSSLFLNCFSSVFFLLAWLREPSCPFLQQEMSSQIFKLEFVSFYLWSIPSTYPICCYRLTQNDTIMWKEALHKRKEGRCPMEPGEVALVLMAMGYPKDSQIYVASGAVYGGENRMAPLRNMYPNLVCSLHCLFFVCLQCVLCRHLPC